MTMISSKIIAEKMGRGHSDVLKLIRKLFPKDYIENRGFDHDTDTVYVEILITPKQAIQYLSSRRNLPQEARDYLIELGHTVSSSASAEGLFGDMLETVLLGLSVAHNRDYDLWRQVTVGKFIFDFYIPAADLYIEYNEQGNHHCHTYDKAKRESVNQEVMIVDYKDSHKENVIKVLQKVQQLLATKNRELVIIDFSIPLIKEYRDTFGVARKDFRGKIGNGIELSFCPFFGYVLTYCGKKYRPRKISRIFRIGGVKYEIVDHVESKDNVVGKLVKHV